MSPASRHNAAPLAVTVLQTLVLMVSATQLLRVVLLAGNKAFLGSLQLAINPSLQLLISLFWSITMLAVLLALVTGRPGALRAVQVVAVLYAAYYWVDRILISQGPQVATNQVFATALTVLALGFVFWGSTRQQVIIYYGERDDRKIPN